MVEIALMRSVVITSAKRTPIGRFLGAFKDISAAELGIAVVKETINSAGIKDNNVDELIFGNARQAGSGPNIARQIAYKSGIPETAPSFTVNKACASSLKAIVLGYQAIVLGDADVVIAGGTESMKRLPFLLDKMREGYRLGNAPVLDAMYRDGFICPLCGDAMGKTAENLAEKYKISRNEQDIYVALSQNRCENARRENKFIDEIVPVTLSGKSASIIDKDEHPRDGVTVEALSKLPPVFKENGTVHAGNSSGITDGAAAVLLMSEEKAKSLGQKPLARLTSYVSVGVEPRYMGIGPVPAIKKLEKKNGIKVSDYDLIELNEAFAAQVIACHKELNFDMNRTNVNGGAIALGHPIGATGARIVVTLLHEMVRRDVKKGLATLCVSGGLGMAVSFER